MGWCRVGIELERELQLDIRARQVPVKDTFRFAKVAMRFSIFLVEGDCLQGCFFRCRVGIKRFYKDVCQLPDISFRPKVEAVARVNQFGGDTNEVTLASQTSCTHTGNV